MTHPDLNLLVALDALLSEGSVVRAAKRLQLSPSAMSRALTRLRETTGDPLLARAGRSLVPTPRALELRSRTGSIVDEALAILMPAETLDLARLTRTFTLRNREGFVENFGPALVARVERDAPGVRLRFVSKADRDSTPLRDGLVDLETGILGTDTGPEIRAQALFRDRFVAVVRTGHELASTELTAPTYAAGRHVLVARQTSARGPVDDSLATLDLERNVATQVGSFSEALALVRATDWIATVPEHFTETLRDGLVTLPLPFKTPSLTISLMWHPRMDADPAHRWLRECVREVCSRLK